MKIFYNNESFNLKEIQLIFEKENAYSNLIKFITEWINNQPFYEFKTSGSTGKPKTINVKRSQISSSVMMTKKALGLQSQDTVLICLNPEYIATIMMVARCLILDMNIVFIKTKSNPFKDFQDNIKIDFASFVPFQIENIINNNQLDRLENIKNILIGGVAISRQLREKLKTMNTNIYQSYGMTETVSHIALMNLHTETNFQVLEGIEIKKDERDCIAIKGNVTDNKWIQTNDIIDLINPKEFKWLGRFDNVINSGGIKIFIEELESFTHEVLQQYNFKNSFFFYGIKDDKLGEKICLVFEIRKPAKELLDILENRIISNFSKYHLPKKIHAIKSFKRTSGKIMRNFHA